MTERCKANPCCGEHYGNCEIPLPQCRSGLWFHNTDEYRDNYAVDRFAENMKAKLAKKREDGRGGWERKDECSAEFLSHLLREHVDKGDPVDVGNLAMMLHQRGERVSAAQQPVADAEPVTLTYTNWRGETSKRSIKPKYIWFGATDWHPEPQWLLTAFDLEKDAERDFALKDFGPPAPQHVAVPEDKQDAYIALRNMWDEDMCPSWPEVERAICRLLAAPHPVAVPDGWKLVPVEPTEEMVTAGRNDLSAGGGFEGVYKFMLAAAPRHPASERYQDRVAAAHHALFHDDPTDIAERLARFMEEANETCQAFGMSREDAHRLVDYTYYRPAGEPAKEIGAAMLTLTSLCVVAGYDLAMCAEGDLEKLQRPETVARIRAKRSTRHGRGPLPGFDTAPPVGGDHG